jgi:hypothetical protein
MSGLRLENHGDELILRWQLYAEDNAGYNGHEDGTGWLDLILPVRAELMAGTLDALELGNLIGEDWSGNIGKKDLAAQYGISKATRVLAAYLEVDPVRLESRHLERITVTFRDWLAACTTLKPAARWRFATPDPARSFEVELGRLPRDCQHGSWYVTSTDLRGELTPSTNIDTARRRTCSRHSRPA